jgi:cytochrome c-type biogenesis protein CcmH/NrfG
MVSDDDAWDAAQAGADLIADGEPARAVEALERLIERDPRNEHAYFFLGAAHFELGDYAKALSAYVMALSLVPNYLGAMVHAGHTLRMLGRYDQAIRMGQQVLARQKDDPDALFLLGASHFARGDNASAANYLSSFLRTGPEVEAATEAHGMLQIIEGQIVPALPADEPD